MERASSSRPCRSSVRPLKDTFPALFAICDDDSVSVAQALQGGGLAIRFRRAFDHICTAQWRNLCDTVDEVVLIQGKDQISWHLENAGKFSVKSMYFKLSQGTSVAYFKDMWEAKVPLKIKIFSWQMALDRLPTSLQIASRHGPATGGCALCGAPRTRHTSSSLAPLLSSFGQCCASYWGVTGGRPISLNSMLSSLVSLVTRAASCGLCSWPNRGLYGQSAISLPLRKKLLITLLTLYIKL
jgi:hypothetical protein